MVEDRVSGVPGVVEDRVARILLRFGLRISSDPRLNKITIS